MPHLPVGLLPQALDAAQAIGSEQYRAEALIGLVPHLPVGLLPQALAAAQDIEDEGNRADALTGLAPHLPELSKGQACQQALAAAQNIRDEWHRARALIGLVPHLPELSKGQACQQALAAAQDIRDEKYRAEALIGLAPHLPVDLLPQALATAQAIGAGLARHLQPETLAEADDMRAGCFRAEALTALRHTWQDYHRLIFTISGARHCTSLLTAPDGTCYRTSRGSFPSSLHWVDHPPSRTFFMRSKRSASGGHEPFKEGFHGMRPPCPRFRHGDVNAQRD